MKLHSLFGMTVLYLATPMTMAAPMIANGGFETPDESGFPRFQYRPTGGSFTFIGETGISRPQSSVSSQAAPEGLQYAFILNGDGSINESAFYQTLSGFTPDTINYTVNFDYSGREFSAGGNGANKIIVTLDDQIVFQGTPTAGAFTNVTTTPVTVSTATPRLAFIGVGSAGATLGTLIDHVTLSPEPGALASLSLFGLAMGRRSRRHDLS